ncbi:MAG: site-specific integrase [Solirubrobacterales bacterium]|nr:site-specific integrase [Solirubrobacterales bacterium]
MSTVMPAVIVTRGKGASLAAYFEAVWHEPTATGGTRSAKTRIGKAWLDPDGVDQSGRIVWTKRRGRVPEGWLSEAQAIAAAPAAVAAWRARRAQRERVPDPGELVSVRQVAQEWLQWMTDVKRSSPATLRNFEVMLREPGAPAKRGRSVSPGRIMGPFGDRPLVEVTVREVADWLKGLDREGLGPRNVNQHRQVLVSIFKYAMRDDSYALANNPAAPTDKRREAPPGRLDYFEIEEVEALARAAAAGAHRQLRGRERPGHEGPQQPSPLSVSQRERQAEEQELRQAQDAQDGELFRVLLYSGMRIGEARALRWANVMFMPDMSGAVLDIQRTVSAGAEKLPKSWKPRTVPVPRPAAQALARLSAREHFVDESDYVFVNRTGGRLDDSAIRRRYAAARDAAGLRPVALHGLRHAAGTMIATGAGVVAARDALGHSKLETTNRYLHAKADIRAVAAMNAAFGVEPADGAPAPAGR